MKSRHRKHNPLANVRTFLSPLFIVHRGAPLRVIDDIIAALGPTSPSISVLGSGSADTPLPELRKLVTENAATDADDFTVHPPQFIVLLNRYFDGPTSRRTFAPLYKNESAGFYLIRVEACALDPSGDFHSEVDVDLATLQGRSNRRRALLSIVPTPYRALCM